MEFAEWFKRRWQEAGETRTTAILRLHVRSGLAPMTIRRALAGLPIRSKTARRLAAVTGGTVTAEQIAFPTAEAA